MKRHGWKLILLLILAAFVFLWLIKAPVMSSYLSGMMRVPVSIGRISMWPSQTTIYNFKIKNPSEFDNPIAFSAQTTEIDYQFSQLMGDPLAIDQILVDGIYLYVKCNNMVCTDNNWTEIANRMPESTSHKEVIIRKLVLTNLTAEVEGAGILGKTMSKNVARIELDNIDSSEGFPTEALIKEIFGQTGLMQYIQNFFNPTKQLQRAVNPLKIFGSENQEVKPQQ